MSAEIKPFKTKREATLDGLRAMLDDPETDSAFVLTRTKDGYWHIGDAARCTSIELVGILEMVKQDVIIDYNEHNIR